MAFPTTSVIEDFNEADSTSPPNANWTNVVNGIQTLSNRAAGTVASADNIALWDTETFGPDCEAYLTIPAVIQAFGVYVRATTLVQATFDGYRAYVSKAETPDLWRLDEILNGNATELASTSQDIAGGEKIGLSAIGNDLRVYHYTGGAWVLRLSSSDNTYTSAGYIGVYLYGTSARGEDFGGGDWLGSSSSSSSSRSSSSSSSSRSSSSSSSSLSGSSSSSSSSSKSSSSSSSSSKSSSSSSSSSKSSSSSSSRSSSSSSSRSSSSSSSKSSSSSSSMTPGWTWGEAIPSGYTAEEWPLWTFKESEVTARNTGDYGKIQLYTGEEFVSPVKDLGSTNTKFLTITYDEYASGSGSFSIEWRGSSSIFTQDADEISGPVWEAYTSGGANKAWRYVQIKVTGL